MCWEARAKTRGHVYVILACFQKAVYSARFCESLMHTRAKLSSHCAEIPQIFSLAPSALAFTKYCVGRRAQKHVFVCASFWRVLKMLSILRDFVRVSCIRQPNFHQTARKCPEISRSRLRRSRILNIVLGSARKNMRSRVRHFGGFSKCCLFHAFL